MVHICGVVRQSIVDGPGLRFVLFTQGCFHHCPGCHNPESHDPAGGKAVSVEKILGEFQKNPLLRGMTLSGGEPILQADELLPVAQGVKALGKDLILYTGYTLETLLAMSATRPAIAQLLCLCDYMVDGLYDASQRDLSLLFRGSRNQRVLDPAASVAAGYAVEIAFADQELAAAR